ncbi:MAG: hypothetical protein A2622_07080 [Bdellovibrionales bacterium RIFCSPHIGHO2_01_FULL_40_29]|nr:MAG: hypothetical protein A2622_07080 [Bdellovibrionales bacterium RIFCSPHIGHO2_01_FULL_40_29]OFZ33238.1 MAG: hypothetical protein A3D17_12100 [Bdellovibrionales bacterium RIFCSPHIGHO2_02_FULL_40_15]
MKLSLKYKIFLASGIWALLCLAVSLIVAFNLKSTEAAQTQVGNDTKVIQGFSNLLTIMVDMETGIRGYLLSGEDVYLEPFNAAEGKFEQQGRDLDAMLLNEPILQERLKKIRELKAEWIEGPVVETMLNRKKLTRALITQEQFVQGFKSSKSMSIANQIRSLVDQSLLELNQSLEKSLSIQSRSSRATFYSASGGLPLGVIIGFGLLTFIMIQVDRQIRVVVKSLENSCQKVFGTSQTLMSSGSELSENSKTITSRLVATAESVRNLIGMTSQNTEHAKVALQFTQESTRTAQRGGQEISDLTHAMGEIRNSASKINEISQLIDDIAFQTNLLALNAAVEAARAGEHGKGFAVVAEAVRSLAQRSATATNEIHVLIKENVESAEKGAGLADKAAVVFKDIIASVNKVNDLVNDVSSSSEKQSTEIQQISTAVQEVESECKSNLKISDQLGTYSEDLDLHSSSLQQAVAQLSQAIQGQGQLVSK